MSYGRDPHYIYNDGVEMYFDGVYVSEKVLNAWLYKVLLTNRRDELARRLQEGKAVWSDPETVEWAERLEDDTLRSLMGPLPAPKEE